MAEPLTEEDIKFYLSIEPDEEAVRKAVEQINRDIEKEKISKIRMEIESTRPGAPSLEPPQSFLQKKFGRPGEIAQGAMDKTDYGGMFRQMTRNLKGDEGFGSAFKGVGKQLGADLKSVWQGLTGAGGAKAAGAAVGAAAGGPAGVGVAAAEGLAKGIGVLAAAPFQAANKGLGMVRSGLQDMQGPLGGIGAGLNLASEMFDMVAEGVKKIPIVGQLLGPLLDQLGRMPKVLGEIMQAGVSMAEKASPGHIRQLGIALEDAAATIGQAFLPMIEEMIPIIREIGTIIAQALPSNEEMRDMFRGLFESIRDLVKELAPLAGPLLKMIVGAVKAIVDVMTLIGKVLGPILRPIIAIVNVVISAFSALLKALNAMVDGIKWAIRKIPIVGKWLVGDDEEGKDKRGAISAARPAWMGGIAEYQQRLQLQTATGPGAIGPESVPGNVGNLVKDVGEIKQWFAKMTPEKVKELARGGERRDSTRRTINEAGG